MWPSQRLTGTCKLWPDKQSSGPARDRAARAALVALLSGALGIAFAPIFVRLSELGPAATAFYRLAFAVPVLGLWMHAERRGPAAPRRPSGRADFQRLLLVGPCFA